MRNLPLQRYHGRRFVLDGAFAIIRANGMLTSHQIQTLHDLQVQAENQNWKEYQLDRHGPNPLLHKPKPPKRENPFS